MGRRIWMVAGALAACAAVAQLLVVPGALPAASAQAVPATGLVVDATVDGTVFDASATRVLYLAPDGSLRMRGRDGTGDRAVAEAPGTVSAAWLTPSGAIFEAHGPDAVTRIQEWRDGALATVGTAWRSQDREPLPTLRVEGPWAVWRAAGSSGVAGVVVRDLATGTNRVSPWPHGAGAPDVGADGVVAYPSGYSVVVDRHGVVTEVPTEPFQCHREVRTDGTSTVYDEISTDCMFDSAVPTRLRLAVGTEVRDLTPQYRCWSEAAPAGDRCPWSDGTAASTGFPSPRLGDYLVDDGTVAFVDLPAEGDSPHLWRIVDGGERELVVESTADDRPRVAAVGTGGRLVASLGGVASVHGIPGSIDPVELRRVDNTAAVVRPDGRGTGSEWADFVGSELLVAQGGTLYRLDATVPVAPEVMTQPSDIELDRPGLPVRFTATASGVPAPSVRWQVARPGEAFADVPGATGTTLELVASWADHGSRYRAVFTNGLGTAVSDGAELRIVPVATPEGAWVGEGTGTPTGATVPIRLSAASPEVVTVAFTTLFADGYQGDDQAVPGEDYGATTGTVTFQPGQTVAYTPVTVVADNHREPTEFALVAFGSAVNARVGGFYGLGALHVLDDDDRPRADPGTGAAEESGVARVPVTLTAPTTVTVSIEWRTVHTGQFAGEATPGTDYVASAGTAVIPAGERTGYAEVPVLADAEVEGGEGGFVTFGPALNAHVGGWGIGGFTITDTTSTP